MSIQAMTWALSIPIPPSPKLTLVAIGNYADENGHCFPSIKRLALDSSQSYDTVGRRLKELESMGLLVRMPRHISPEGILNFEGRGRRTSDEIRLRLTVTADQVRDGLSAAENAPPTDGDTADDDGSAPATCPPQLAGSAPASFAGTVPALVREHNEPSLEPKKESPLPPKMGGEGQDSQGLQGSDAEWEHAESWARIETEWGDPVLHQRACRRLWETFTEIERQRFPRVMRGYLVWRLKQPKLPLKINLQKLMRERDSWPGYEKLAGPDPSLRTFIVENSLEHRALQAIAQVGGWPSAGDCKFDAQQGKRGFWRGRPLKADELAMAQFSDKPPREWTLLERGTKPFFAWSSRLADWTGARRDEIRVPCLWPPRRDGTIATTQESTGPPDI